VVGCGPVRKEAAPSPSVSNLVKTACGLEMVLVPGGGFTMGSANGAVDTKPPHAVKLDAFLMDRTEVTQEAFEGVMAKNPSRRKHPKNPVEQVTWTEAVRFCNARSAKEGLVPCYDPQTWECDFSASGYRLPTEAEWEYACAAGSTNQFHFGDQPEDLKLHGWFEGNSQGKPHPVAHFEPNAWGLYDMAGNVWEWCNDFYGVKYYRTSPVDNPRGPREGEKRVLRGGAWSTKADQCASTVRNCDEAGQADVCLTMDSNGFRCVRKPGQASAAPGAAR